jgi:hypothetical protein
MLPLGVLPEFLRLVGMTMPTTQGRWGVGQQSLSDYTGRKIVMLPGEDGKKYPAVELPGGVYKFISPNGGDPFALPKTLLANDEAKYGAIVSRKVQGGLTTVVYRDGGDGKPLTRQYTGAQNDRGVTVGAPQPGRSAAPAAGPPRPQAQPRVIKDATGITRVIGADGKAKYFLPDHTPTDAQTWRRATYALGHDDPAPTPGDYFKAGVSGFGDIIGTNGRTGTLHQMGSGMAHGIGDITAPYVAGAVQYGKELGNRTAGSIKAGVALSANGVANATGWKGARQVAANEKRAALNSFAAADRHQILGNADVDNGLGGISRATPGTLKDLATAGGYYAGGDAAAGTHTLKQIPVNYLDALQNDTPNALMTFGATILPVGLKGAMGNALRMEARSAALSEQSAARAAIGDARGAAALQAQADLAAKQAKQSRMLVDVGTGKALTKPVKVVGKAVGKSVAGAIEDVRIGNAIRSAKGPIMDATPSGKTTALTTNRIIRNGKILDMLDVAVNEPGVSHYVMDDGQLRFPSNIDPWMDEGGKAINPQNVRTVINNKSKPTWQYQGEPFQGEDALNLSEPVGTSTPGGTQEPKLVHLTSPRAKASINQEKQLVSGKYGLEMYAMDPKRVPSAARYLRQPETLQINKLWNNGAQKLAHVGRQAATFVNKDVSTGVSIPADFNKYFKPVPAIGPIGLMRKYYGVQVAPPGVYNLETKEFLPYYKREGNGQIVKMGPLGKAWAKTHQGLMGYGFDALIDGTIATGVGASIYTKKLQDDMEAGR